MPLASSSLVQVTYIEEATFGVTPNVGNSKELRITGESLDYTISKESSAEINSSRTVSSMVYHGVCLWRTQHGNQLP